MKKINILLLITLIVISITVFTTNIIFNKNVEKYQKRSYSCCEYAINTNSINWKDISPSAPCGCADTYNILQKTFIVLGIIDGEVD